MMKIFYNQDNTTVPDNTGIGRVVHAQCKYLPEYGWEITRNIDQADIIAAHANATDLPRVDVLHIHGLYWTGDRDSGTYSRYHDEINKRIASDSRRARVLTVPSRWVAEPFLRDMRRSPVVIGHGVDLDQWKQGDHVRSYALWNKNRSKDVCNPQPAYYLAQNGIPVLSTFAPDSVPIPQTMKIIGYQPHEVMRDLIMNAGVYIATTRETFGIGTLEALASGVPVLGFYWGGTADIITHQYNGYLVEPGDYEGLIAGYQWLIDHRHEIGQNARDSANLYGWREVVQKYAELYEWTVNTRNSALNGVSVVIPNYNYAKYVREAVESCLQQTRKPDEIIVVDDGSTDDSIQILSEYAHDDRIKLLRTNNHGVATARNNGIDYAVYPHIICLDADDMLDPRFIEVVLPVMQADRGIGIAYTGLSIYRPDGEKQYAHTWPPEFSFDHQMTVGNPPNNCIPSACMFRRDMWERIGGYQQIWAPGEDAEFWTRGISYGYKAIRVTEEPLYWYRLHEGSATRTKQYTRIDTWLPWMRDKLFPFAVPSDKSVKVRSYSTPVIQVRVIHGEGAIEPTIDSIMGQTLRDWVCYVDPSVSYDTVAYPFVREYQPDDECYCAIPFQVIIRTGEYFHPQFFEDTLRHFVDSGELGRGIHMACNCGSKKAAKIAKAVIDERDAIAIENQASGIVTPTTIRMEFIGIQTGARTFYGKNRQRTYHGGRNIASRYADVNPEDVEILLVTEQWRVVPIEPAKPVSPPEIIRPTYTATGYNPDAIIDNVADKILEDMPELPEVQQKSGKKRGRPRKVHNETV